MNSTGGMAPFSGMNVRVIASPHWPRRPDGVLTIRSKGHWLVYGLSRVLRRFGIVLEPDVVWTVLAIKDIPPFLQVNGAQITIHCSPSQEASILANLRASAKASKDPVA